ncbi:MAG: YebY family protein [Nitrospirota bacterium]
MPIHSVRIVMLAYVVLMANIASSEVVTFKLHELYDKKFQLCSGLKYASMFSNTKELKQTNLIMQGEDLGVVDYDEIQKDNSTIKEKFLKIKRKNEETGWVKLEEVCLIYEPQYSKQGKMVTKTQYGERWPLSIDKGQIECMRGAVVFNTRGDAVVFNTGYKTYALNGFALQLGYPRIDDIWLPNEKIPGTNKSIGPLLDDALKLCK